MFEKIKLSNGLTVVLTNISQVRSLAIGVWVKAGVVNEEDHPNGISHFTEHMLFKGTEKRTSKQIAKEIEDIGGEINAFTSREFTCYYTRALDEYGEKCLDILSDIVHSSVFDQIEIEKERNVIRQEISMYEDTPDELIHDLIIQAMWSTSTYGRPISGTKESIENIDHNIIKDYVNAYYRPHNMVISVAGSFDKDKILNLIEKFFNISKKERSVLKKNEQAYTPNVKYYEKNTEQNHICIGYKSFDIFNDINYSLSCFNSFFGSGMSSILFQKIREELGLVYSVYSYSNSSTNGGSFIIYSGLDKANTSIYFDEINKIIKEIKVTKIDKQELDILKNKLRSNYILALESPTALMNYTGSSEIMKGYIRTPAEISDKIEQISLESVYEAAGSVFEQNRSIVLIGNSDLDLESFK